MKWISPSRRWAMRCQRAPATSFIPHGNCRDTRANGHSNWIASTKSGRQAPSFATHCCRSEEHTSELQSLMRISYAVFCLKKKKHHTLKPHKYYNILSTQIYNK